MNTQLNNIKIALRHDTLDNWNLNDNQLLKGEYAAAVLEDGTTRIKIGDGVHTFNELPFIGSCVSVISGDVPFSNDLSVVKLTNEEYNKLVAEKKINPAALYVITDNYTSMRGAQLKDLGQPTDDNDAATKHYVDDHRLDWSAIYNTPTTLAGYGIEDASISENTITLGAHSVTIPTALKCPNALTINVNGELVTTYDGSAAKTLDLTLSGGSSEEAKFDVLYDGTHGSKDGNVVSLTANRRNYQSLLFTFVYNNKVTTILKTNNEINYALATSVGNTLKLLDVQVPVVGNGLTLGLTNGTDSIGMYGPRGSYLGASSDAYGKSAGSSGALAGIEGKSIGITTDADNSGLVADLSSSVTTSIDIVSTSDMFITFSDAANLVSVHGITMEGGSSVMPTPSAPLVETAISWNADKTAIIVNIPASGTLTADTTHWVEGQSQTVLLTIASSASISPTIVLVGENQWITDRQFIAECIFVGGKVYLNPITTVQ